MKVLVTGASGQLGFDVVNELVKRKIKCLGVDRQTFDIRDTSATEKCIIQYMPDRIVHCAAFTKVDQAEDEYDLCYKVNCEATGFIAEICKNYNIPLLYISTDYVFDGESQEPYSITSSTNPINVYGKSKLGGENEIISRIQSYYIVRTSWVFGRNGTNFVKTMLNLAEKNHELAVVEDQIGSPTYTVDLASLICDMLQTERYGIYHATNEGFCSWADFAQQIFSSAGINTKVKGITSELYSSKAKRPKNTILSKQSLDEAGFKRLPCFTSAIKRFLHDLEI